jgi:hypothetical protein
VLEFLDRAIKEEKEIQGIQIGKEEVKLFLFADDMILYTKNPKNSNISTFSKAEEYKISTQKSATFLYTNSEHSEKKIRKIILFAKLKYLRINLTKEVTGLYNENYKSVKKENNDDIKEMEGNPMLMD